MTFLFSLLLASAFGWAAVAKTARPRAWSSALNGYRLPRSVATAALVGVPVVEVFVAGLLLVGGDAGRAGAALGVALLAAFSMAVLRARGLQGDRLPCGCFGGSASRDYRLMLVRNSVLGLVAAAVLVLPERPLGLDPPGTADALPAVLVALGLVLVGWLVVTLARVSR